MRCIELSWDFILFYYKKKMLCHIVKTALKYIILECVKNTKIKT